MRYLVTGTAGFIGSKVAGSLLEMGHEVIGIDNCNDYYDVRLKNYRLSALQNHPQFQFYKIDIERADLIEQLFQKYLFDGVLHLAARAGVPYSMKNPEVYITTNVNGTLHLLDSMVKNGVRKMVMASTSSLYAGQKMPFNEELPVNTPISPYAASKKAAEVLAYSYYYLYKLDISIVRYFTVYGPAGRPDMSIFRFIQWIDNNTPIELFGDGEQGRDFTYVDDIAQGTIAALKPLGYEIINLGGGKNPITLRAIIGYLEELLKKKVHIKYNENQITDIKLTWADITKAGKLLNWSPKISIQEGLRNCVEWYQANKMYKWEL